MEGVLVSAKKDSYRQITISVVSDQKGPEYSLPGRSARGRSLHHRDPGRGHNLDGSRRLDIAGGGSQADIQDGKTKIGQPTHQRGMAAQRAGPGNIKTH